ncbi:MAG: choice-of-anchor J domain-containing protein [Verrucomicrobia bacterium]|nr:choice-of-anchor J domain-containing protein [Verrucomicrobiota bacterium]
MDIDDNDDGIPNAVLPWDYVIDAIGVVHNPFEGEFNYGAAFGFVDIGPDGTRAPGHVFRYSDTMEWAMGQFDPMSPLATDTPRAVNPVAPTEPAFSDISGLLLEPGEVLVIVGERLQGTLSVAFNGTNAQVNLVSNNRLDVVVPNVSGVQTITVAKSFGTFEVPFRVAVLDDPQVIFYEDFQASNTLGRFTDFSVLGDRRWVQGTFSGVGSARLNGFGDNSGANDDWLITEPLDLSNAEAAVFNFRTAGNFTGPDLELYVSSNYVTGTNPNTADWTQITGFNLPCRRILSPKSPV